MESAHSQVKNLSHWEGPGDEDQLEAILYCQCQHDMVREETWLFPFWKHVSLFHVIMVVHRKPFIMLSSGVP